MLYGNSKAKGKQYYAWQASLNIEIECQNTKE